MSADTRRPIGLALTALVGISAGVAGALLAPREFVAAWHPIGLWVFDLSLGSLVLIWLHDVAGGPWGPAAMPAAQVAGSALPLGLIAALWLGWAARLELDWIAHPAPIPELAVAPEGAVIRSVIYAGVWLGLAAASGAWRSHTTARRPARGAIALLLHVPLVTLFAMDWLMIMEPHWYSTAAGLRFASGQLVAGIAVIALAQPLAATRGLGVPSEQHRLDVGTLLLAAVIFWAYVTFMQFLIIWIGDVPEEITWYLARSAGGSLGLLAGFVVFKFALPSALLLSRRIKRNPQTLAATAALVLLGHAFDLCWQSNLTGDGTVWLRLLLAIAALAGLGGAWLLLCRIRLDAARPTSLERPS
ncbi:MAG TPA: hypothetical protein VLT59_17770 [Steroidobacteraceae bacterium]|nr:hypothetical protein [Steroidobacteraceae bacterium]